MPSAGIVKAAKETEARIVFEARDDGQDENSPSYRCASYREQLPDVEFMRDVFGGTKTMREKGQKYLPKHPMENDQKYEARLKQAVGFNAVRKTVEGLSGMIFRRDATPSEDMPEKVEEHLENIDLRGNKLSVFLHEVTDDALLDGHCWIHVEAPRTDGVETAAQAEELGIRPYWIRIKKKRAINWRYEIRGGRAVLTLFVYLEGANQPAGGFGEEQLERIRVLREGELDRSTGQRGPVRGELWELREVEDAAGGKKKRWVKIEEYDIEVSRIPVVFVPSEESGTFESRPPLLDLGYEQVEHYRVRSDRQKSMTFASIAVPYVFGNMPTDDEGTPKLPWGPDGIMLLTDGNAKAGMIESQGFGLTATKEELEAIKQNMASLGLKMLVRPAGVTPQTATSELLTKSEGEASLAQFAVSLEDAANLGLELHAEYQTDVERPGSVKLNRDFYRQLLTAQDIQVLGEQVAAGRLSIDTMWDRMVRGEWLPEDFDAEEERARIEKDGAAGLGGDEGDDLLEEMRRAAGETEVEEDDDA